MLFDARFNRDYAKKYGAILNTDKVARLDPLIYGSELNNDEIN